MLICNACRYREGSAPCSGDGAAERLPRGDLVTWRTCHNCGERLYACQYAPPHEFAVNVPRTLAQIRLESYESYAWPAPCPVHSAGTASERRSRSAAAMIAVMLLLTMAAGNPARPRKRPTSTPSCPTPSWWASSAPYRLRAGGHWDSDSPDSQDACRPGPSTWRRGWSGSGGSNRTRLQAIWSASRDALTLANLGTRHDPML